MSQLVLDFRARPAFGRADFLVSDSNRAALAAIDRWPAWPGGGLVLHGPAGCGKTHLVHVWRERSRGLIADGPALAAEPLPDLLARAGGHVAVEDAEAAPEHALLHLWNLCRERRGTLLVAARRPPAQWRIALADLGSRLRTMPSAAIGAPDDTLLAAVLVKHFADRQLRVAPAVVAHLVDRIERSFAAAAALAERLDRAALAEARAVTIPLVRRVLAER